MSRNFVNDGNYINYPNSFNWQGEAITISLWFKENSGGDSASYFWHVGETDSSFGMALYIYNNPDNNFKFARWGTTEGNIRSGLDQFVAGTWYHLLATHDGVMTTCATTMHFYLDGTIMTPDGSEDNGVAEVSYGATNFSLGARNWETTRDYVGDMAEFATWNRVLSTDERLGLAAGYSPAYYPYSRINYMKLIRSPIDEVTGNQGSLSGTTVTEHVPGITYPVPQVPLQYGSQEETDPIFINGLFRTPKRSIQIPVTHLNL